MILDDNLAPRVLRAVAALQALYVYAFGPLTVLPAEKDCSAPPTTDGDRLIARYDAFLLAAGFSSSP